MLIDFRRRLGRTVFKIAGYLVDRIQDRLRRQHVGKIFDYSNFKTVPGAPVLWFHGASSGELEHVFPLLAEADRRSFQIVVTAWSTSALSKLERWKELFPHWNIGLSPKESQWGLALQTVRPIFFTSVKYEAWPNLWWALSRDQIPLGILCAQPRPSLSRLSGWFRFFGIEVPKLFFFDPSPRTLEVDRGLKQFAIQEFQPPAEVLSLGDPRCEQIEALAGRAKNDEFKHWVQPYLGLPRPFFTLGNVWSTDLPVLRDALLFFPGTVFFFPHVLSPEEICAMERMVKARKQNGLESVLVRQMGILGPFYSLTDLAYVGGGFGKGVHSLLEAAYSGAPTASGPNGFDRSWEGQELRKRARVTMVFSSADVQGWLQKATQTGKFPGLNWGGASQSFFAHVFQKLHP